MKTAREIWEDMLVPLSVDCASITYDMWVKTLEPYCIDNDRLILVATSKNHKDNVNKRLKINLKQAMRQSEPFLTDVIVIEKEEEDQYSCEVGNEIPAPIEIDFGSGTPINPRYNFEEFVVGKSNQFAVAAAHAVCANPGVQYNPLFIYGDVGLGKTHIIHAIANDLLVTRPDLKVLYVTSEKYVNDYILSVGKGKNAAEEFRNFYRNADVLIVDDVQFFGGKGHSQEEFFHTFNSLHDAGKQLIFTSDRPPKEIKEVEERLRSRFEWGLKCCIDKPDLETRIAILLRKSLAKRVNIPIEVLSYISEHVQSNIRELEGVLNKIVFLADLLHKPYSIELAADALIDFGVTADTKIPADVIIDSVCRYYGVNRTDLLGKRRNKEIVEPRQVCMYLVYDLTAIPQETIGSLFGGRDHSTVTHACNKIENEINGSAGMKQKVDDIRNMIYRN